MLKSPTPFPYVGSYALIEHEGEYTLARIQMRREGELVLALPLRDGAGGNLRVPETDLIDGTPLTAAEQLELRELDRALAGQKRPRTKQKRHTEACWGQAEYDARKARRDALKRRVAAGPILDRLMRFLPSDVRFAA